MRILIFILLLTFLTTAAFAMDVREIQVGRCTLEVAVMENPQEHAKGLLGYTERSFPYDGMLFIMNRKGRKVFHTQGMQMNIRIMGVSLSTTDDVYRLDGFIQKAPPGMPSIIIDAPDVLEIPENKYQLRFKRCLGGQEGR